MCRNKRIKVVLVSFAILAGSIALSARASAEVYDEKFFGGLSWRSIGPKRGGRSIAAAGSTARHLEYYFGVTGGGVWKTTDGGTTWKPVTDEHFKTSSVGAIAVAESNPDIVYVGMGETELRGNIAQGDGVYKSTDAGETWEHMGLEKTMAISRVRVHPKDPDRVYVAAFGNPFHPNSERGVYRSADGGKTWELVLHRDEKTGAVDLVIDPWQSEHTLCCTLGGLSVAPLHVERRPGKRPFQVHRWRRHLEGDNAQRGASRRNHWKDRCRCLRSGLQSGLCHRGKR